MSGSSLRASATTLRLPERFHLAHEFTMFLQDYLVRVLQDTENAGAFSVSLEANEGLDLERVLQLSGVELFDFLERYGRDDVISDMHLRGIFPALVADLCRFLFMALKASETGYTAVTYALLRKPFRENLFYLEWLLAEPEEFIETFHRDSPHALNLGDVTNPQRAVPIIRNAVARTAEQHHDPDWLYRIRFDKSFEDSFDIYCNQAMHLVTVHPKIKTETQSLNFVFSDDAAVTSQWIHLYTWLPQLTCYAVSLIEMIALALLPERHSEHTQRSITINRLHRQVGQFAALESIHPGRSGAPVLICPRCREDNPCDGKRAQQIYTEQQFRCIACSTTSTFSDLVPT